MKFQNQAFNERSPRQSRRDSKNDLFWCLTLACVLVLLGSALVRVCNLADSKASTFTRTPPDQLQADARTLVAMLHYLAEPEPGVATPFASNEAFDDNTALAHTLFAGLRDLDSRGVTVILCPLPANDGLGHAIRDRLEKAAKLK